MWLTKGSANCGNRNAARLSTIHRCVIGWLRRARTRVECTHGRRRKNPPTALGQSWTYAKHDLVTGITVDTEVDRISAVVRTVEIESHSGTTEDAPVVYPSWGPRWSRKYSDHTRSAGRLPGEVQDPWGMVLVDPHWTQLQVYEKPIPLWPCDRAGQPL
jgi:hypothetical protein